MSLPWQPAKTAPKNKTLLVLFSDKRLAVGWLRQTCTDFLGTWVMTSTNGKEVSIGWPIAWTDLPELPSDEEFSLLVK